MLDQSPIGNRRALSAPTDAATRNLQLSGADAVVTGYGPSYTPYVPYAGSIGRDSSSYFYESGTPFSTSDASVSPKSARRSFMAPASRGKHLPLLHPSVALRSSKPRSKLWTAGIIVGSLVVIAGLVVVCATVADKSSGTTPLSGAPGNIIGVGGYTVRTAEYAAYTATTEFWNKTLRTFAMRRCGDAPAYDSARLPNGDVVTVLEPELSPSGDSHALCPVIHLRVDDIAAWVSYLKDKNVELLGQPLSCNGVSWQYFSAPDGNVFAVSATAIPAAQNRSVVEETTHAGGRRLETRDAILGVSYAGGLYTELAPWGSMLSFWQNTMGLPCVSCPTDPQPGDYANFVFADGDRLQLYFQDASHAFMNQCMSPGLEVGDYTTLRTWYSYLSSLRSDVTTVLSNLTQSMNTQGWFWISSPSGGAWSGTSPSHNVLEIVASATSVKSKEP